MFTPVNECPNPFKCVSEQQSEHNAKYNVQQLVDFSFVVYLSVSASISG